MSAAEKHFGLQVKRLRKLRGTSQEELADRAGIHSSYVSQLERGCKSPSLGVMLRIASALEITASELLKAVEDSLAAK